MKRKSRLLDYKPDQKVFDSFVAFHGGLSATGRKMGVTFTTISKWRNSLPPERAAQIEDVTEGRWTARELLPQFAELFSARHSKAIKTQDVH